MTSNSDRIPAGSIFETIRNRICLLDYPPGAVLRELDLAREFGVSRTPIRSALQRLTQAGLIESRDGFGTLVTDLDFEEIEDIYHMRIRIAESIGQMNPRDISESQRQQGRELARRAQALRLEFDIVDYWIINHDQHNLIAEIIGNGALRHMWNHFYYLSARVWYRHAQYEALDAAESLVSETAEVARALAENNALALGRVQANYISYGLARLQNAAQSERRRDSA